MAILGRGHLVVVQFPFSDLSHSKLRPALIVGEAGYGEFILCQITSRSYHGDGIEIDPENDVPGGSLRATSYVRPLKLFTANRGIIRGAIGVLDSGKFTRVVDQVVSALRGSRGC